MGPAAILNILITANNQQAMATIAKTDAAMKASAATAESTGARTAASYARTGQKLQTVGNALTKYVTLPAAAVGVASVKMAKDFNDAMMQIHTSAGASTQEVERMHDAILALARSGKVEQGPKQLAEGLFHIESQGFRSAKALTILKAAADGADVGNASLEDTTKALGGVMKALHAPASKATAIMSQLIKIVGQGDMRMQDLVSALSTGVVPAAKTFGLTLRDVGAALDVMTQRGMGATQSATRLRMTFSMLAAPTDAAKEALASIGLSADELANTMRQKNLPAAVALLAQHLEGVSKTRAGQVLSQAFGGGRTSAAIMLLTQNVGDLRTAYAGAGEDVAGFNAKLRADAETTQSKLNVAWSQIQASLISVGESLGPVVAKMAQMLAVIAKLAAKIPAFAELLVVAFAAGPIIKFIGWIYRLRAAYLTLAAAQATAGLTGGAGAGAGILGGLGAGAAAAAVSVAALATALGGLYAAYKNFGYDAEAEAQKERAKNFEAIIARMKASGGAYTAFEAHQVNQRILQYAKEGKVKAEWARDTYAANNRVMMDSKVLEKAQVGVFTIIRKNLHGLGETAKFEMAKVTQAIIHGKDPMQALAAAYRGLADAAIRQMNRTGNATDKQIRYINRLIDESRRLAGLAPIPGGFLTPPSQQHGPLTGHGGGQGAMHRQHGGLIPVPGYGTGDRVPAMLEPGEVVVNRKAVAAMGGARKVNRLNQLVPRFAGGGILGVSGQYKGALPYAPQDDLAAAGLNILLRAGKKYARGLPSMGGRGGMGGGSATWRAIDALAAQWGLSISSGFRPGSITSSGNLSYHAQRGSGGRSRATDYADSPHAMLVFARKMSKRYGHNLAELIHTPLGYSIKNGSRTAPIAASDHYSHVHVAMQRGGIAGNWNKNQLTTLASFVGMRNPALMAAIAMAESGGNSNARGGAGEYGLWQIMPFWGGGRGLLDPVANARKAKHILGVQGLGAWTTYTSGAYRHFLGGQVKPGLLARLRGGKTGGVAPPRRGKGAGAVGDSELANIPMRMLLQLHRSLIGPATVAAGAGIAAARKAIKAAKGTASVQDDIEAVQALNDAIGASSGLTTALGAWRVAKRSGKGKRKALEALIGAERALLPATETSEVTTDNSEMIALLQDQADKLAKQLYVSQAQYKVLAQTPYAGSFAGGGVVPGPTGAPRLATVHGGERIGGQPVVIVQVLDGAVNANRIRVISGQTTEQMLRQGGRSARLPGRAGGM